MSRLITLRLLYIVGHDVERYISIERRSAPPRPISVPAQRVERAGTDRAPRPPGPS
jgi:hypothetical protein